MTPEERAAYKKKSIDGGLTDAKGNDKGDHLNAHWKVENGELVNGGTGPYATTVEEFGDIELLLDANTAALNAPAPEYQVYVFRSL